MRIKNLKLKRDISRIEMLHILQYFLFIIAFFLEFIHDIPNSMSVLTIIGLSITYRLYYQTMKKLYYTFWTFSFFILVFLLYKMANFFSIAQFESAFLVYALIMVLLICECYILSSPIYYPRVNWWEYDFRYRADLKVTLKSEDPLSDIIIESRLSDVRRGACCLSIFENLEIGSKYILLLPDNLSFIVEIMSNRQYSLGRPKTYGVKFIFENNQERKAYKSFECAWNEHKYNKKQMKFKKSELT